ncbi:ArsR/SmtB family transcription factor [Chloroflexota bacterium]
MVSDVEKVHNLTKIAQVLSSEIRIRMLKLLTETNICVCEMRQIIPISHSQVSRHLKALMDVGFLKHWHEGKCVVYIADRTNSDPFCRLLINLIADSFEDDELISDYRRKLKQVVEDKIREKSM